MRAWCGPPSSPWTTESPQSWPPSWTAARWRRQLRPWPRRRPWPPRTGRWPRTEAASPRFADHGPLQQGRPVGLRRAGGRGGDEEHPGRRGPEAVQLQHHGGHDLGQQRHAGHGGRQLRPQDGGGPALPGHSGEDHAAGGGHQGGQRSPGGRHRRGAGLRARKQRRLHLGAAGLQGGRQRPDRLRFAVGRGHFLGGGLQDSGRSPGRRHHGGPGRRPRRQGGRQRAGPALHGGRTSTGGRHQNSKCPAGPRHEAFVAAQLASRDASITALQASKADATLLASYATNAALSASETTLQSALDAILAELAALQLSGSGVVNAPAWAGFTTWELLRGSSVVRNLHFVAPLSAALANGDDTLSITADCYSTAGTDAAITAALLAHYTSAQVDALPHRGSAGRGDDQRHHGRTADLLHRGASGRAVGRLPHGERAGHADAGGHRGRTAGLPDGPGPGRLHHQPNHLGAGGVPLRRRPGHGNDLEHRRRAAQLLHHHAGGRFVGQQARSHGGSLCAADSSALSGRRRGRQGGGRHRRADPGGARNRPLFGVINGGAEGPGRRLQREGPAEAVPTCEAARPRRLRGAEGRRGPAGAGAPAARAGQVGRRGAQRPAAGRPHRLQPEHAGEDEVRPGGDGRLHPRNLCRTRTPRRWAAPPSVPHGS